MKKLILTLFLSQFVLAAGRQPVDVKSLPANLGDVTVSSLPSIDLSATSIAINNTPTVSFSANSKVNIFADPASMSGGSSTLQTAPSISFTVPTSNVSEVHCSAYGRVSAAGQPPCFKLRQTSGSLDFGYVCAPPNPAASSYTSASIDIIVPSGSYTFSTVISFDTSLGNIQCISREHP